MGVTLINGGNRMGLEIRPFHGLKDGDLMLRCHFAVFYHLRAMLLFDQTARPPEAGKPSIQGR